MHYGGSLLQSVATRIIARYLRDSGAHGVVPIDTGAEPERLNGVDIVCNRGSEAVKVKVKADAYYGTDPRKIADQGLSFYRGVSNSYAFETIAHHVTREPGWMVNSDADELFYYFIAIDQTEDEVVALMEEPDEVFFPELSVERDDLHVLPMQGLRRWFEANNERYTPRPVTLGDHSGWYRIIPIADIDGVVPGVAAKGAIMPTLTRR